MTNPNIVNVASINGKTDVLDVGTSVSTITSNGSSSGQIYKINSLIVSNVDGSNDADITVDLFRNSTSYKIANTIRVPANSTLVLLSKDSPIYLEEGDSIRCTGSETGDLQAICSYEIIQD